MSGFGFGFGFSPLGALLNSFSDEAKAFFAAASITDNAQKRAINTFIADLKAINDIQANAFNFTNPANSIIKALYPFIGGSAAAHRFNLINPVDSDAAFRATFSGTVAHTANGIKGNGTDGYLDLKLNPSTDLATNDTFIAFYSLQFPVGTNKYEIGTSDGSANRLVMTGQAATTIKGAGFVYNANVGQGFIESTIPFTYKCKMQAVNRFGGKYQLWINGVKNVENTNTGGTPPNRSLKALVHDNNGSLGGYSARQISMLIVGKGLSDAAIVALNTACNTLQTNLNRYPYNSLIQFDGDSLTYGIRAGVTSPYPDQLMAKFGIPICNEWYNYGVSGQTLAQMITDAATQVDAKLDATKDYNIVLAWGGVNDFGQELSTTKEEIYTRLKTYCTARKAAGFKVYAFTLLPQSNSSYVGRTDYENERIWFNQQVRTDLLPLIDGIVDVALDSRIGLSGCQNDTTYYLSDKLHLSNTGYGVVADLAYNAIKSLYDL